MGIHSSYNLLLKPTLFYSGKKKLYVYHELSLSLSLSRPLKPNGPDPPILMLAMTLSLPTRTQYATTRSLAYKDKIPSETRSIIRIRYQSHLLPQLFVLLSVAGDYRAPPPPPSPLQSQSLLPSSLSLSLVFFLNSPRSPSLSLETLPSLPLGVLGIPAGSTAC